MSVCLYVSCVYVCGYVCSQFHLYRPVDPLNPSSPPSFRPSPPVVVSVAALSPHPSSLYIIRVFTRHGLKSGYWETHVSAHSWRSIGFCLSLCINIHFSNLIYFEFLLSHHYAVILGFQDSFSFLFWDKVYPFLSFISILTYPGQLRSVCAIAKGERK